LDLVGSAEIALAAEPHLLYVVAGDGAFRSAMEEECRRRKLMPRFRFLGWVEYSRIPALMQMADMIVSMSESEGLSRVYLEAQASARLLIASDIAPARELIEDGVTGLLFRKGDVADLAKTTVRAARNRELRMGIGRAAARRVEANSLDRAIHRYLNTIAAIVRDSGRQIDGARGPGQSGHLPSWQEAGK
jgi:glycosyltransferase involved in cell wall biosynthesis